MRRAAASKTLGTFRHRQPESAPDDVRCDLHPRWSPDGRVVTVDSIHDGCRGIWLLKLAPALEKLSGQ